MAFTSDKIIEYYDSCEIDYRWLWNLNDAKALHYGYWDDGVRSLSEALTRQNDWMAELAGITSADSVLDAGCGVGGSSIHLAKNYGCTVTGISLAARQIEQAQGFARAAGLPEEQFEFLVRDFTDTRFEDASFTVVWAVESVCHAERKADFLREAFRVLQPGGRLILCDGFVPRPWDEYTGDDAAVLKSWVNGWAVDHLADRDGFVQDAVDAGFTNVSFEDITERVLPSARRLYRLAVPTIWIGRVAEFLRIRSRTQTQNIIGARDQYRALRRGLWRYGRVYAEKSK